MEYRKLYVLITALLAGYVSLGAREVLDINKGWLLYKPYRPWSERMSLAGDDAASSNRRVDLPHDFSIDGPFDKNNITGQAGGYLPGGKVLYRKNDIFIPEEWKDKKIFVEFDGVYQNSEVYINGILVGFRPNGWVSFGYDISKWIYWGEKNMIAVKVDNTLLPNCRWYSGSGIWRPVRIIVTDKLSIDQWGIYVTTPEVSDRQAKVKVETTVENLYDKSKEFTIEQQILDKKGRVVAKATGKPLSLMAGSSGIFEETLTLSKPELWDTEHPNLYTLKTIIKSGSAIVDELATTFGVRSIEFDADRGFFLNGKSVKMKGVCLHHDGGMVGAAVPDGVWIRRLNILKDMGCNAIRTSHNPFNPSFYDLCNSMGFLVMDEFLDEWSVLKLEHVPYGSNLYWDAWHVKDLTDLIKRDRNHPSIVIWSVGNEIIEQAFPEGYLMARKLVQLFHKLDPTRPVTCGNNKQLEANMTGFADEFDVVGYNYGPQFGNYERDRLKYPKRKFIGTESTRGKSTRGIYAFPVPADGRIVRTENDYFSSYDGLYRKHGQEHEWKVTNDYDYIAGMFIWTGIDYIGETSFPWPTKYSDFAPLDACCFPKDAYYFYRSVWNNRDETLHIFPHWNWPDRVGKVTPVWCYSSCDEVELSLNGKSQGRKKMGADGKLHIEWSELKYEPGELKAIGYRNGKEITRSVTQTTGEPVKIELAADHSEISADGYDVVHIEVRTVDKEGRYVPTAQNSIHYSVKGGKLLGIDSGDPQYVGNFKTLKDRKLFNGLSLVIVQSLQKDETIEITASGEGLVPASVRIEAKN